jgi:hypothetical protein
VVKRLSILDIMVRKMAQKNGNDLSKHIGTTVLVVTMEVDAADDAEFNEWYNEQHLPERMAIPGYVSARRFKLEGDANSNALQYLCIWEMEDGSPLQSEMYKDQNARPTELFLRVNKTIKARTRGLYTQVYPEPGTFFADRAGFHGERLPAR